MIEKKTSVTDWALMITTGYPPPFNTTTEPRVYCNNSPDDAVNQTYRIARHAKMQMWMNWSDTKWGKLLVEFAL